MKHHPSHKILTYANGRKKPRFYRVNGVLCEVRAYTVTVSCSRFIWIRLNHVPEKLYIGHWSYITNIIQSMRKGLTTQSWAVFICLCLVYSMLPVSPDCPFSSGPSVFSNVYWISMTKQVGYVCFSMKVRLLQYTNSQLETCWTLQMRPLIVDDELHQTVWYRIYRLIRN